MATIQQGTLFLGNENELIIRPKEGEIEKTRNLIRDLLGGDDSEEEEVENIANLSTDVLPNVPEGMRPTRQATDMQEAIKKLQQIPNWLFYETTKDKYLMILPEDPSLHQYFEKDLRDAAENLITWNLTRDLRPLVFPQEKNLFLENNAIVEPPQSPSRKRTLDMLSDGDCHPQRIR